MFKFMSCASHSSECSDRNRCSVPRRNDVGQKIFRTLTDHCELLSFAIIKQCVWAVWKSTVLCDSNQESNVTLWTPPCVTEAVLREVVLGPWHI
jgi:hypothetical protein